MYPAILPQGFGEPKRDVQYFLLAIVGLQGPAHEPLFVTAFPLSFGSDRAVVI